MLTGRGLSQLLTLGPCFRHRLTNLLHPRPPAYRLFALRYLVPPISMSCEDSTLSNCVG